MDLDSSTPQETQEVFEEIENTGTKLEIKENVSLLDRGKGTKKRSRTNSPTPSLNTNMTRDQIKFCGAIMRNLKKHRDAVPFLHPVDYVKLNVPEYPKIIKHPMDLTTVDRKLNAGQYDKVEDFVTEIRLVFNNCFKFNGPEAMISMLCQNVESAFEKSLRQMPPSKDSATSSRIISPENEQEEKGRVGLLGDDEGDDMSTKKKKKLQRPVPHKALSPPIRDDSRPKREIHPPPSKDYPETMTKRRANNPRKNDVQLKFCVQALKELKKTKYRDINYPFLAPVDVVALNIPDYVNIVKRPMDISTIERKLNEGEYDHPDEFEADIRLMFNNCYLYNPATLPVHKMARDLERAFDEKWAQLPPAPEPTPEKTVYQEEHPVEEEEEEEVESDDERDQKIAELERHIASISQQIVSLKSSKKKKTPEKPARRPSRPVKEKKPVREKKKRAPNTNNNTNNKKTNNNSRTAKRKPVTEELPEFTFDQKKDLSEQINNLTGDRLNTVVNIIQSSMPNLDGQGQEEIVLDIDSLDRGTLHRLHEFVTGESLIITNNKASSTPAKRQRTHYSQADSDRKIREIKDTLKKFSSDPDTSSESDSESDSGTDTDDSGSSSDEGVDTN